jgi:hypothetical protein
MFDPRTVFAAGSKILSCALLFDRRTERPEESGRGTLESVRHD